MFGLLFSPVLVGKKGGREASHLHGFWWLTNMGGKIMNLLTVRAPGTRRSVTAVFGLLLIALSIVLPAGAQTAFATSYTVPWLMITEVTPDSKQVSGATGTPDAFEFIELYNNSTAAVNLKNYRIIYETPTIYKWIIAADKTIPAKGTLVLWIKSVATATLAEFNQNYGTALTAGQVYEISASGMANTASRTISIANSTDTEISTVTYDPEHVLENVGIPYLYPTDGTKVMRLLSTDTSPASPGSVYMGQVPPAAWENVAPAKPTGLTATPGSGKVTLSWSPNSESDLAFYRVYIDGVHWHTYRKEVTSVAVTGLTAEQNYTFEVTAVDTSNNASLKAAKVAAPLSIALTQESVVSPPSGSFPEYSQWFSVDTAGPLIPGLKQNMIPQGLAYAAAQNWLIITHYREDGGSSMLSILNASTGALVKSVTVYNADQTAYVGHAGGVAVSASNVWISSEGYLHRIPLPSLVNAPNRSRIYIADRFPTGTRSSYTFYASGKLWSGEFHASGYETDASHQSTARDGTTQYAWIVGFNLDGATDLLPAGKYVNDTTPVTPDAILSVPDKVQGATRLASGRFVLSESYGRTNDSTIQFYENVLAQVAHAYRTVNGTQVPFWFLDGVSRDSQLTALPLSENVVELGGYLYVLFESAATPYVTGGKYPTDKIWKVNMSGF